MRNKIVSILSLSLLLSFGTVYAKDKKHPDTSADRGATASKSKPDVTYGRIKELTPGEKVVVDVDNSIDKSYDLTDRDTRVNLAGKLKVGDPVKITEREVNGKKTVQIVHHAARGVKHGDKSRAEEPGRTNKP